MLERLLRNSKHISEISEQRTECKQQKKTEYELQREMFEKEKRTFSSYQVWLYGAI